MRGGGGGVQGGRRGRKGESEKHQVTSKSGRHRPHSQ